MRAETQERYASLTEKEQRILFKADLTLNGLQLIQRFEDRNPSYSKHEIKEVRAHLIDNFYHKQKHLSYKEMEERVAKVVGKLKEEEGVIIGHFDFLSISGLLLLFITLILSVISPLKSKLVASLEVLMAIAMFFEGLTFRGGCLLILVAITRMFYQLLYIRQNSIWSSISDKPILVISSLTSVISIASVFYHSPNNFQIFITALLLVLSGIELLKKQRELRLVVPFALILMYHVAISRFEFHPVSGTPFYPIRLLSNLEIGTVDTWLSVLFWTLGTAKLAFSVQSKGVKPAWFIPLILAPLWF